MSQNAILVNKKVSYIIGCNHGLMNMRLDLINRDLFVYYVNVQNRVVILKR